MITEAMILHKVEDTYALLGTLRGNPEQQRLEHRKLTQQLQKLFQKDRQRVLDIFWQLFREERGYYEELFLAIIDTLSPEAIQLARQILLESNEYLREEAARFLGDSKVPTAVPELIEALKSEDYNVVTKSALALGEIGDSRAEPYLLEIVDKYDSDEVYSDDRLDDAYPIIRHNAFNALCLLNTSAAQQKIMQSLFHDRDIGIQLRAIRYLVAETPMEAIPYLEKLSQNSNEEVATLAKDFLEELDPKH
jgi:HEAT repeat protein